MSARLAVLGAGAIVPRVGYGPAGYALELEPGGPVTLFDCGPGSVRALPSVGLDPVDVTRVVVSHFHTDHVLDLFALAFLRRNPELADRVGPLELVGPAGLARLVEAAPAALGRWVAFEDVTVREVAPDDDGFGELATADLGLRCATTGHTPDALAWRADWAGGSLVYSGDSPVEPRVGELARDADLFVVECSFSDEVGSTNHLTPAGVAELVRIGRPRRVLLSHFYPPTDPAECVEVVRLATGAEVFAARDGLSVSLG